MKMLRRNWLDQERLGVDFGMVGKGEERGKKLSAGTRVWLRSF
jgi:hypothetical protein